MAHVGLFGNEEYNHEILKLGFCSTRFMPNTGEICDESGIYRYDGNPDGVIGCQPTPDEYTIPMKEGEPFPPVRSCEQPAKWKLQGH